MVTQRRRDGSLVVDHADGRGRVVLPGDYVGEHVALSYAVGDQRNAKLVVEVLLRRVASGTDLYLRNMPGDGSARPRRSGR